MMHVRLVFRQLSGPFPLLARRRNGRFESSQPGGDVTQHREQLAVVVRGILHLRLDLADGLGDLLDGGLDALELADEPRGDAGREYTEDGRRVRAGPDLQALPRRAAGDSRD